MIVAIFAWCQCLELGCWWLVRGNQWVLRVGDQAAEQFAKINHHKITTTTILINNNTYYQQPNSTVGGITLCPPLWLTIQSMLHSHPCMMKIQYQLYSRNSWLLASAAVELKKLTSFLWLSSQKTFPFILLFHTCDSFIFVRFIIQQTNILTWLLFRL